MISRQLQSQEDLISSEYSFVFDDILLDPDVSNVESRKDCDVSSKLISDIRIDVPILAANMDTVCEHRMMTAMSDIGALGVLHRFLTIDDGVVQIEKHLNERVRKTAPVAYAVGVDDLDRVSKYEHCLLQHSVKGIAVLDVAHGVGAGARRTLEKMRKDNPSLLIVAGNVANWRSANALIELGADAIKIGVGPGSVCTTRTVTGCGNPQLSAILEIAANSKKDFPYVTLIADGGIRSSGDIVKAFWAGADTVMLGGILSGTDETPGEIVDGVKYFRGMASFHPAGKKRTAEGVQAYVPAKGPVVDVIDELVGGIQSGMAYLDASTIPEITMAVCRLVTATSISESRPHVHGSIRSMSKF